MEKRNVTVSAIVAAIVLIGDQLSKHWAETWLRTNGEYKIWDGVLHLRYVENRGAAFGMMQGGKWFFLAITGIACAAMLYFLIKERKRLHFMMTFSIALLLSGAIGNLIDRCITTYVRDFIHVYIFGDAFPFIFNVADMALVIGAVMLIIYVLFMGDDAVFGSKKSKEKRAEQKKAAETSANSGGENA